MPRVIVTPSPHLVFNEFDKQGLLLDLPRISEERNYEYKQRLLDVFINRASSTYRGLINAITRELGLSISDVMKIQPVLDSNGDPLVSNPAVEFIDTKCYLYNDFMENDILLTIDRFDSSAGSWTLGDLADTINATGYYTATLLPDAETQKRSMTIFNQSSIGLVPVEDISGSGSIVVLNNNNLIEGTVTVRSDNLSRMVALESDLVNNRTYLVRHKEGILVTRSSPAPGSFIRYSYRNDDFIVQASPIILHNLQSNDFRNYMFENAGGEDEDNYGLPTRLGATIINELMSVHPANWGE